MSKDQRFLGKIALLSACTKGIGLAVAERLAQEGAKVIISSRRQENVESAIEILQKKGYDVIGHVCHVSNGEQRFNLISKTLEGYGGIDFLFLNAAVNPAMGEFLQISESKLDKIMEVNIKSNFLFCREVIPYMEKRGGGSIVLMNSHAAFHYNNKDFKQNCGFYNISKTAMLGLTKALSLHLIDKNIRVNAVAPGLVKTDMSKPYWKNEVLKADMLSGSLIGRVASPEEVASVVPLLENRAETPAFQPVHTLHFVVSMTLNSARQAGAELRRKTP